MLETPNLPVYAFDIDGVLCHTYEILKATLEKHLGVDLHPSSAYDGHFGLRHSDSKVMQWLKERALSFWSHPAVYGRGKASGQQVIAGLAATGRFAGYVTRRDAKLNGGTLNWLIGAGFPALVGVDYEKQALLGAALAHPLHHAAPQCSKADHVKALRATCLVEDSPSEAREAAQEGVDVVVIRRNYNRDFEQEVAVAAVSQDWARRIRFIDNLEELL